MPKLPGIASEYTATGHDSAVLDTGLTPEEVVQILNTYRYEAEYARLSGPNSRDLTWLMHWDMYWNRYDFSRKAPWQARELTPEFPQFVDRFAAAMRTSLVSVDRFFTVQAANDEEMDVARVIKKVMATQLRRISRSPSGHPVDFLNIFEELMKAAALTMGACIVTQKEDINGATYTAIDPVDAYNVWLDPTGRNLYRIRRVELDLHELEGLASQVDGKGIPLYRQEEIERCTAAVVALMRAEREKRTGTGQWTTSNRKPVILHEYLCTLITNEGKVAGRNVLCVVANNEFLIRGPEKNPFWHKRDWLITAPIITVPMSPYGRSYVENFSSLARTFNELTNLLLDGVFTSSMKAFAAVPQMLEDPRQLDEGIYPNVVFQLTDTGVPQDFIKEINLGELPPEAYQIWQAIKKEMQEGAAFNELSLGQLAPKGRTSATEVGTADQNANSYIRAIASNIETLFLEPTLDILWKTTIQHLDPKDEEMKAAIGEEWFDALLASKKQFCKYRIQFICRGISTLIAKTQKLQGLLQLLQVVMGNPLLAQTFMQQISPQKLLNVLYDLMDIEVDRLEPSPREQQQMMMAQQAQQMMMQAMGQPGGQGAQQGPKPKEPTAGPQGGQQGGQGSPPPAAGRGVASSGFPAQ